VRPAFPLEQLTSFRIGGPADRLALVDSESGLRDELRWAADEGLPARALGGGKNLLVDDRGVRGLVVSLCGLRKLEFRGPEVVSGAGVPLSTLIRRTAERGLSGMEVLAGVPGTVGGAVRMNAGGAHGAIGEVVRRVAGYTAGGEPFALDREGCGFAYRQSALEGTFLTEIVLRLVPSKADLRARAKEILSGKRATQPLSAATAGCVFKNPVGDPGRSAGWLLEQAGMKGRRCGAAQVSPQHANFVMNLGGATFHEVMTLLREGRDRVLDRFGVDLSLELEVWKREEEPTMYPASSIACNP
jgi:UDP-N-acetylmuramate dehydrogenase